MNTATRTRTRPRGRVAALLIATAVVALPTAVLAQRGRGGDREIPPTPEGVTVLGYHGNGELLFTGPLGRLYGEVGDGYAVIVGAPVETVCSGETPEPTLTAATKKRNGTWETRIPLGGLLRDAFVYEIGLDEGVFDFFDRVCPIIGGGGEGPAVFAQGEIRQRDVQWDLAAPYAPFFGPQPPGGYKNSAIGKVVDDDGRRYELIARANYRVNDDGSIGPFSSRLTLKARR